MKKKHWKVSVFDKTSETIRDDTLYTTDTEVYLVFELIDEDFTPDSATVTIYNIYGTATINESVDIVDGIVSYEIPEEAIGHPGGWRTQVVFTKDNEDYTTTVIEFDVDGHLLDNKKPKIVHIENWNNFIKHAEHLVDGWEQLEKIRQANERKRERAESVRKNEFETNETGRQANELVREENEQTRETAEFVRVTNEEERISKDSERDSKIEAVEGVVDDVSSKLDNKANKKQEGWITPTLLNGWGDLSANRSLRYRINQFDMVEFKGGVSGGTVGQPVMQLPIGYRPPETRAYIVYSGDGYGRVAITVAGLVQTISPSSNTNLYFDQVSFYID